MEKIHSKYYSILLLGFSILFPLYFIQFGVDFTDTFFHYNNVSNFMETGELNSAMTFLSTLILATWGKLFGHTIISYRIFNYLLCLLILILPLFYFRKKIQFKTYIVFFSIASISYVLLLKSLIGYDSISDFFIVNAFFSFYSFLETNNKKILMLTSFFIACATATRFPDLLMVPLSCFTLFVLFLFKKKTFRETVLDSVLVIASSLFFYISFILFSFGSAQKYWSLLTHVSLNNTYTIGNLLNKYFTSFYFVAQIFVLLCVLFLIMKLKIKNKFANTVKNGLCLSVLCFFLVLKISKSSYFTAYSWSLTALFLFIGVSFFTTKNVSFNQKVFVVLSLFFSLLPALGSNTGLLKVNTMFYVPFIMTAYNFNHKKIVLSFLCVFFGFAVYERFINTYDDKPFAELNVAFESPVLKGIQSSFSRVNAVNKVQEISGGIVNNGNEIVFFGMNSHVYNSVTGIKSKLTESFDRSFNNKAEIKTFDDYLKTHRNVYFIVTNDYVWGKGEDFENSSFKKLMDKYAYKRKDLNQFMLFIPD